MKIEVEEIFSRETCKDNPNKLYIFGENKKQKGTNSIGGGQAIIRGLTNTYGFCTLGGIGEFWHDDKLGDNIRNIISEILDIERKSLDFDTIVFPKYGLGTGRANMILSCPMTFNYMNILLFKHFGYNNIEFLSTKEF